MYDMLFGNSVGQTKIAIVNIGVVASGTHSAAAASTMTEVVFKDIPELFEVSAVLLSAKIG